MVGRSPQFENFSLAQAESSPNSPFLTCQKMKRDRLEIQGDWTVADAWSPAGADPAAARRCPGGDRSTKEPKGRRGRFLAGRFGPAAPTEGTAPREEEGSIRQETDRVRGLGDVLGAGGVSGPWSSKVAEVAWKRKVRAAGPVSRVLGLGRPGRGERLAAFKC